MVLDRGQEVRIVPDQGYVALTVAVGAGLLIGNPAQHAPYPAAMNLCEHLVSAQTYPADPAPRRPRQGGCLRAGDITGQIKRARRPLHM